MTPKKTYYSVEKHGGIWWLKAPDGERQFYTSVQCVNPVQRSRVAGSPHYDGPRSNGGDLQAWISKTQQRLKDWGFRGLGAWHHPLWYWRGIPFTQSLDLWKSLRAPDGLKPVFDPDFAEKIEARAKRGVEEVKRCPGLVGYFLDNELPWHLDALPRYFGRKPGDPNRTAVLSFLRRRYRTIGALNRAWGCRLRSFAALARLRKLPVHPDLCRPDALAFLGLVARTYFKAASGIVRRLDPDNLILGVRHAGLPPIDVTRAQRGFCDVYSVNLYIQEAELDEAALWKAHLASGGRPVWITEFSFHAPHDNRSGDRNKIGFGSRVQRQSSRGPGYRAMVSHAASLPFVIGTDWFQYSDEPPKGRGDGEDVNFGLVDIHDRPYAGLVQAVRATNRCVDRVHGASSKWRPRLAAPAVLPELVVPGAGVMLKGLRLRPNLDRHAQVPAQARIAWKPGGLTVDIEVKDAVRTVDIAKLKDSIEWFWTTDFVELLLRQSSAVPDFLDRDCLKVWAVPDGRGRGKAWLGGWHGGKRHSGKVAGARVRQRGLKNGYALQFFIPASAVQPEPFKAGQSLRFNLLIDDSEKVLESCWSAHQGQITTEKPRTWGLLKLTA